MQRSEISEVRCHFQNHDGHRDRCYGARDPDQDDHRCHEVLRGVPVPGICPAFINGLGNAVVSHFDELLAVTSD